LITDEFWPTPIWRFDLPEIDPGVILEDCFSAKTVDPGTVLSNGGGWQSISRPVAQSSTDIKKLLWTIEHHLQPCCEAIGMHQAGRIGNYWININGYKDFNYQHCHPGAKLSGVYYVQAPKTSGNLVFPRAPLADYIHGSMNYRETRYNKPFAEYEPVVGQVLVFPAELQHSVNANMTKEFRVSIAFNVS
jgi:uncharacterized protein (TIGR02466 family)